jgi:hypothetical protein
MIEVWTGQDFHTQGHRGYTICHPYCDWGIKTELLATVIKVDIFIRDIDNRDRQLPNQLKYHAFLLNFKLVASKTH